MAAGASKRESELPTSATFVESESRRGQGSEYAIASWLKLNSCEVAELVTTAVNRHGGYEEWSRHGSQRGAGFLAKSPRPN
jgi:hypothetical protein